MALRQIWPLRFKKNKEKRERQTLPQTLITTELKQYVAITKCSVPLINFELIAIFKITRKIFLFFHIQMSRNY